MKNKLTPCPNCGGEVHIEIEDADYPCYEFVVCENGHKLKIYHLGDGIKYWNNETNFENK